MKTDLPILLRVAAWWSAHGIRGRGVVSRCIGRCQPTKPPLFIQTRNGAALSVDYNNFDVYANIYNNGGCWDENVMDCCEHLLRPGDVFYDIGANTGIFALDLAKIIPNLKVVAFEPQPSLAENIRRSAERNAFANLMIATVGVVSEGGMPVMLGGHIHWMQLELGCRSDHYTPHGKLVSGRSSLIGRFICRCAGGTV